MTEGIDIKEWMMAITRNLDLILSSLAKAWKNWEMKVSITYYLEKTAATNRKGEFPPIKEGCKPNRYVSTWFKESKKRPAC